MSFSVNQRTPEFGVRMALGADRNRILGMVLRQGSVQIGIGLFVGMLLTFALATVGRAAISQTLFGVDPRDPIVYGSVVALIVVVSLVATLVPARRATRVDPMVALRAE
jgi:ABC-type antimicrobial peptide transport system permease subunit